MLKYLILAAMVPLAVLGADLASHPVILQQAEEQKPIAVKTFGDRADILKAQKISFASQDAIDKMEQPEQELAYLEQYCWLLGIIYFPFGVITAFQGAKQLPYIAAPLSTLFVIQLVYLIFYSLGMLEQTEAQIGTLCGGLVVGIGVGFVVWKDYGKSMLACLGLVAGFYFGRLVFALICNQTGWDSIPGYWGLVSACAVIGCFLACIIGVKVAKSMTAGVGSYLIMRACILMKKGYTTERLVFDSTGQDALDMGGDYWIYPTIFVIFLGISLYWQCQCADLHKEVKDEDGVGDDYNRVYVPWDGGVGHVGDGHVGGGDGGGGDGGGV